MAESYCLKSCTDCAREGCCGCKTGGFADQCEIARCCKEKNHESCDSCTRSLYCPTRTGRDQMPEKIFAMERREAELAVKYRGDAEILAKWVKNIFWLAIAGLPLGVLGLIPALAKVMTLITMALSCAVCYCYYRLKIVDEGFGVAAGVHLAGLVMNTVSSYLPEGGFLNVVLALVSGVCGLILVKYVCNTFRDALSGINREMSEKWENQWLLYKIGLFTLLGCLVVAFIPVLNILAAIAILVALVLLLFLIIREYVYLWQTAMVCRAFAGK